MAFISSRVVGYINDGLTNGNQLVSFSFTSCNTVDSENQPCIKLSSVKPTGYENNETVKSNKGINGDYTFQILKTTGKYLEQFQWIHKYDTKKGTWGEGYWKSNVRGTISESNDVLLRPGQGFWCTLNKRYNIEGAAAVNSGNAVIDSYTLSVTNGNQVVGVPTSFAIPVSKIVPGGYMENETVKSNKGINGDFTFQILKTTGKYLEQFQWVHKYDTKKGTWSTGYWKSSARGTISETNEAYLPAGSAVWFTLNKRYNIEGANIVLPGMDEL